MYSWKRNTAAEAKIVRLEVQWYRLKKHLMCQVHVERLQQRRRQWCQVINCCILHRV